MIMAKIKYIPKILIPLVLLICSTYAEKVPLMIWSSNNDINLPHSHSLMDDVYPGDFLPSDSSKTKTIAFVQNNIDLEQFSNSNLPFISKLFEENQAVFYPYSQYEPNVFSNFDTLISLNGETVQQNEQTIKSVMENQTGPAVFMLTGKNNVRYELLDDQEKTRIRRKADDGDKEKTDKYFFRFPENDPCLYVYLKRVDLYDPDIDSKNENDKIISFNVKNINAICNSSFADSLVIFLENKTLNKEIDLTMTFEFHKTSMWRIRSVKFEELHGDKRNWTMDKINSSFVESGFSYSCSKRTYQFEESTKEGVVPKITKISLYRFQVQPFNGTTPGQFEESFDCSVWFTIPIFSGLFVCLLLLLILYCGIRALMSISTPDRFENPKSKGLILTGVEE